MRDESAIDDPLRSVLGVIDLKGGRAVHAVRGGRDRYRAVCCDATSDGDAMLLAQAYIHAGVGGLDVADLDAITDASPNRELLNRLIDLGHPLWLDAGTAAVDVPNRAAVSRIVGTESIESLSELERWRATWSDDVLDVILSIDLKQGHVLARSSTLSNQSAVEIAADAVGRGFGKLVVLDLAAVGASSGPVTQRICQQIAAQHSRVALASGGGIRDAKDVDLLINAGCRRILVGTALHDGRKKFLFGGGTC